MDKMVKRFCAKCGKEIDINQIKNNFLCQECYNVKNLIFDLKKEFFINICPECNSYLFNKNTEKGRWKYSQEKNLIELIGKCLYNDYLMKLSKEKGIEFDLELDAQSLESSKYNYINCKIIGLNSNGIEKYKEDCKITIKNPTCINCAKTHGKRFEAIIQIRNSHIKEYDIKDILVKIEKFVLDNKKQKPDQFITDIKKLKNGFDLYLSHKTLLGKIRTFAESLNNFIVKSSKTLVGRNPQTGGDLYRTTLLLRILPLKIDDKIDFKNNIYKIKKINNKNVYLEDYYSKKIIQKKFEAFENKTIKIIDD